MIILCVYSIATREKDKQIIRGGISVSKDKYEKIDQQVAVKQMQKGDVIVNTSSITAYNGSPGLMDYSATKEAITSFTRSLALNLADQGIRVNAVAPGPIWTTLIPLQHLIRKRLNNMEQIHLQNVVGNQQKMHLLMSFSFF